MSAPDLLGQVDLDRGTVQLRRLLPSPLDGVWRALTVSDHTVAWIGPLSDAPVGRGDRFTIRHDDAVLSQHTVVRWEPSSRLELTWDFPDEEPSRLLLTLRAVDRHTTELDLLHEGLGDPVSYAAGWHRHLDHLDTHLRGTDRALADLWSGYDELAARYRRGAR